MFKYELAPVNLDKQRADVWEIFKDSSDMFSDLSCQIAGHKRIDTADKLFDLFYWTLHVSRGADYIGIYNQEKTLIGMPYITHIEPLDYFNNWNEWEASYHGSMHPDYRSPKYSDELVKKTITYFICKHELNYLFSWPRADNRLANLILLRNGFEFIDIMKNYRHHGGVPYNYNLFIYRG